MPEQAEAYVGTELGDTVTARGATRCSNPSRSLSLAGDDCCTTTVATVVVTIAVDNVTVTMSVIVAAVTSTVASVVVSLTGTTTVCVTTAPVTVWVTVAGVMVAVCVIVVVPGVTVTAKKEEQSCLWAAWVARPFVVPVTARAQLSYEKSFSIVMMSIGFGRNLQRCMRRPGRRRRIEGGREREEWSSYCNNQRRYAD